MNKIPFKTKYKSGYKYQSYEDETLQLTFKLSIVKPIITDFITISPDGQITIRKYYAWDGCSGPTWDTKSTMRGGKFHDALYQLLRMGLLSPDLRDEIDEFFYQILIADECWKIRAKYYYQGVRIGAAFAAKAKNRRKIISAP